MNKNKLHEIGTDRLVTCPYCKKRTKVIEHHFKPDQFEESNVVFTTECGCLKIKEGMFEEQ